MLSLFILLRQTPFLNRELRTSYPVVDYQHICATTPGFLCGCWWSTFRSSCFLGNHFTIEVSSQLPKIYLYSCCMLHFNKLQIHIADRGVLHDLCTKSVLWFAPEMGLLMQTKINLIRKNIYNILKISLSSGTMPFTIKY